MSLTTQIKKDLAGEKKAIKDYGQRKATADSTGKPHLASKLAEIQDDEKDHRGILTKVLVDRELKRTKGNS